MTYVLGKCDLWRFTNKTALSRYRNGEIKTRPPSFSEQDAFTLLYELCSPDVQSRLGHISRYERGSAARVWEALRLNYAPLLESQREKLLSQWSDLELRKCEAADSFMLEFSMIWDALKADVKAPSEEAAYFLFLGKISRVFPDFAELNIDRRKRIVQEYEHSVSWLIGALRIDIDERNALK